MHYLTGVILPFQYDGEKLNDAIGEILAPWDENEIGFDKGQWDWWQLGGRWTGTWSDYDPEKDPENWETCRMCQGTGVRTDPIAVEHRLTEPSYTCNGCGYGENPTPGTALKWPTSWVRKPQADVVPVDHLLSMDDDRFPYAIVTAPDIWIGKETWDGTTFVKHPDYYGAARSLLEKSRGLFVAAVDIHS